MITILNDNFSQLNEFLHEKTFSKIFILVDENTHEYCLPVLLGNMETDLGFEILEIEAGEETKNIQTANQLWEILTEMQADRKALVINLGGGVITDMGGFVASDKANVITTLGRGGSDYTAAIVGAALDAEEVQAVTDALKVTRFPKVMREHPIERVA